MKLNKLELKTTNGFKINDIDLDINIPTITSFKDFIINNSDNIKIEINNIDKKIDSKIGLVFDKYLDINIVVPKDTILDKPVEFIYEFKDSDVLIDRFNIIYEENTKVDFVIKYISKDNGNHFHHLKEVCTSKSLSNGSISIINMLNDNSYNFIAIENDVLKNSTIKHNILDIGGNIRLNNVYSNVYESAINILNNIYMGKYNNIIDMNYTLNNIGYKSINNMKVEGVLDNNSKKNFRGTIDFKKGCSESVGEENENCVLLSDTCISRSLPSLLCHEENVVGAHGVSSGKVEDSKLFYLMSRGLEKKEAEKLIVKTNLNTILKELPTESLYNEYEKIIDDKLS